MNELTPTQAHDNIKIRAYVLYVFHRYQASGQMSHSKKYIKRFPEDIQRMENVRGRLHREAVNYLKSLGKTEEEIHTYLEDECEKGIKNIGKDLVNGELACGCCKVKVVDWNEHQNSELHKLIEDEIYFVHTLWRRIQAQQMLDKMNNFRGIK